LIMHFTKMHGVGNDFIVFDPGEVDGTGLPDLAQKVCDRHFGLGADGILVPAPSEIADLKMVYLNSDGSPSAIPSPSRPAPAQKRSCSTKTAPRGSTWGRPGLTPG
jgi:hypothetical protein